MDNERPASVQGLKDAEDRRASNSGLVFLGWIGLELAAYAVLVLTASDEAPRNCSGLCFSDRGTLVLLGMMFGLFVLVGQLIVGLLLTKAYNRRRMTSFATGSAAYFTTFILASLVLTLLAVAR
ncbi:hypothetical protein [Kribbella catacumbae]|uniref:hypothetical protein n=1 Tax=Kribbella catacumbae TaxID=460086 RepID=UPI000371CFCE|nr:hypothetical protein [Kribbella catacumbae]